MNVYAGAAVSQHVPLHVPLLVPAVAGEADRRQHEVERGLRVGGQAREEQARRGPRREDAAQGVVDRSRERGGGGVEGGGGGGGGIEPSSSDARGGSGGGGRGKAGGGAGESGAAAAAAAGTGRKVDDVAGELPGEQRLPDPLELGGPAGGSPVLQGPHEVSAAGLDDAEPGPREREEEEEGLVLSPPASPPLVVSSFALPLDQERPPSELPRGRGCRVGGRVHPGGGSRSSGPAQLREQAQRRQEPRLQQMQRRARQQRRRRRRGGRVGGGRRPAAAGLDEPVKGLAQGLAQARGELQVARGQAPRPHLPEQGGGRGLGPAAAAAFFVAPLAAAAAAAAAREQRGPDGPREAEGDRGKKVPVAGAGDRGERRAGDGLGLSRGRDREDAEATGGVFFKSFLMIFP